MRTDDLDYELPAELIATRPAEPRDSARMLVMYRSGDAIEHRHIRDLPEYLHAGDALVFNNTAVGPARLIGRRADTAGRVEGLFLETCSDVDETHGRCWRMMLKSGGRLHPGQRIEWLDHHGEPSGYSVELVRKNDAEWIVRLEQDATTETALDAIGWTPLPPYILHARKHKAVSGSSESDAAELDDLDRHWYQTVYADAARRRSVAAPTAGLHFTPQLLTQITKKGIERIDVTLHVGPGTFKPVTAETLEQHRMHAEWFEVSPPAIAALRRHAHRRQADTRLGNQRNSRVIAVGTTTVRTLESLPHPLPDLTSEKYGPMAGMTDLMIAPPFDFRLVDGMLTNFHLPRSTLLALVAAMVGLERLKAVYAEAIRRGYRFYSYGDAMLILP